MPLISVIVPVYNVEKYLNRCVDSILNQTLTDFELILVDDESTDRCGLICDEYVEKDSRVKVIHKKNGGVSSARNAGIEIAKGEYISFCDSDDYVKSDWLEVMYNYACEEALDCVSIDFDIVSDSGTIKKPKRMYGVFNFENNDEKFSFIKKYILAGRVGWSVYTRLFKTKIIIENNILFCETCDNFAEDMAFSIEYLMCSNSFGSIDYSGYYYYQRENSMMHNSVGKIKLNSLNEVSKHFYDFLDRNEFFCKHKRLASAYPLIHCLIMINQLSLVNADNINKSIEVTDEIVQKEYYKKMMYKVPKYYKELSELYGKQMAFEYCILCRYTVHKNFKRYCIASALYYKFLNRR